MRVVCIVGPSDAGKTTLVERLLPVLADDTPVGTVKSIHHDVELDDPGKDTHRHRTAGADRVVGVTPSLTATFEPRGKADDGARAALERALDGFDDDAVVLVEGFDDSPYPRIRVGDADADVDDPAPVLARVDAGADADVEVLADRIRALDDRD